MRSLRLISILALAVLASACGAMNDLRMPPGVVQHDQEAYVERNSATLSAKAKKAIRNHRVFVGMHQRHLLVALGRPQALNRSLGRTRDEAQFVYRSAMYPNRQYAFVYVDLDERRVTYIQDRGLGIAMR